MGATPTARRKAGPTWMARADVAARAVAAIFVGYLLAALVTAVLARVLPGSPVEATIAATTLSFAVYAAVAVWCFVVHAGGKAGEAADAPRAVQAAFEGLQCGRISAAQFATGTGFAI